MCAQAPLFPPHKLIYGVSAFFGETFFVRQCLGPDQSTIVAEAGTRSSSEVLQEVDQFGPEG
jgi:hypothetical protein